MVFPKHFSLLLLVLCLSSCKVRSQKERHSLQPIVEKTVLNEVPNDTTFVALKSYSDAFAYDMKYATTANFLKQAVYDCPECYLRYKTVKMLIKANEEFLTLGYRIKLFDCYRPLSIQKKMWQIVSDPQYVANPAKGSIHNRGCAVDLTLIDRNGNELDMGTPFDFFGEAASHNYTQLAEDVLQNRKLLREVMLKHQFKSFDSEWWHYNLVDGHLEKVANFNWKCE